MNEKEQILMLIEQLPEEKSPYLLAYLQGLSAKTE